MKTSGSDDSPPNEAMSELAEPGTSAERLQQLAHAHPELGAQIAAHPNCYPELQQWIAQYARQVRTTPEPASTAAPEAEPAQKHRRPLKIIGVVTAIVLPLVTAVSITIPLLANLNERESSHETLRMLSDSPQAADALAGAEVIGEHSAPSWTQRIDWYIPAAAPIETFPLDAAPGPDGLVDSCSEAEFAWLERYAKQADFLSSFDLTLHNSSTTGASLPLGNIRFEGEEVESEPVVRFQCPAGGRGDAVGGQPLLISTSGEEAVYGEAVGVSGEDVMPEGSPVTLNLAPGEVSVITLTRHPSVDTQHRFEGRFVADLLDGSDKIVVLAEEIVFTRAPVDDFYVGYESGASSNVFVCTSPTFSTETTQQGYPRARPCTLGEAAGVLREAAAAVR